MQKLPVKRGWITGLAQKWLRHVHPSLSLILHGSKDLVSIFDPNRLSVAIISKRSSILKCKTDLLNADDWPESTPVPNLVPLGIRNSGKWEVENHPGIWGRWKWVLEICWISNNSALRCAILLAFGRLVHYCSRDKNRERLAGRAVSSGNASLIANICSYFFNLYMHVQALTN